MNNIILDDIFGFKLYKSFSLIKGQVFHRFFEEGYKINFEQWIILNRLWDNEGQTQKELLSLTMQSKGNFARTLNSMEKENLILRKQNPNDLRSSVIFLTRKSKKMKEGLLKIAFEVLSNSMNGISKKDIAITNSVLDQIINNLRQETICGKK
jgi:MarR family transcriptional regulator, organic hydroperoxide resistance regulator